MQSAWGRFGGAGRRVHAAPIWEEGAPYILNIKT